MKVLVDNCLLFGAQSFAGFAWQIVLFTLLGNFAKDNPWDMVVRLYYCMICMFHHFAIGMFHGLQSKFGCSRGVTLGPLAWPGPWMRPLGLCLALCARAGCVSRLPALPQSAVFQFENSSLIVHCMYDRIVQLSMYYDVYIYIYVCVYWFLYVFIWILWCWYTRYTRFIS